MLKEIIPEYSLKGLMAEAEAPTLCPPDAKSWLNGIYPDVVKDWGKEEKGMTEDEMVGGITNSMDISVSKHCHTGLSIEFIGHKGEYF